MKHWCSCSLFLIFDEAERTTVKSEWVRYFFYQFGKYTALVIIRLRYTVYRAIKECILFPWMSMKVEKKIDLMFFVYLFRDFLDKTNFRMQNWIRVNVFSVEILTWGTCTTIPNDYSIRVYHGHDYESSYLSQLYGLLLIRTKPFYETHDDIWAVGLAWVDSSCNENYSFLGFATRTHVKLFRLVRMEVSCSWGVDSFVHYFLWDVIFLRFWNMQNWYVSP